MKISKLHIENFRAVSKVVLDNLQDTVIIVGANGCGKSTIFDAIRLIKSIYGSYSAAQNELQMFLNEFQIPTNTNGNNFIPLMRNNRQSLLIKMTVIFSETELSFFRAKADELAMNLTYREYFGGRTDIVPTQELLVKLKTETESTKTALLHLLNENCHEATLSVEPSGQASYTDNILLKTAFSTFIPDTIGIFEYINASRTFNKTQISGININNSNNIENTKSNSLYNLQNKYGQLKNDLATIYFQQYITNQSGLATVFIGIKQLFEKFFPNKEFIEQPSFGLNGTINFNIKTLQGIVHDIDELSSGEKEILMGYLRILTLNPRNSVIMFDEPELHLHPKLVKDLPSFYSQQIGLKNNNQIWLITHSDTLLKEVIKEINYSVYHMVTPERVINEGHSQVRFLSPSSDIDSALIDLIGDLSQYNAKSKVVILEGQISLADNSEFDKYMITSLFPELSEELVFISAHNKHYAYKLLAMLQKATTATGYNISFYSICDKDTNLSPSSDAMETSSKYLWDVYHIENYLLVPKYILQTLANLGNKTFTSEATVKTALLEIAKEVIDKLIIHELSCYINDQVLNTFTVKIDPNSKNIYTDFCTVINSKNTQFGQILQSKLSPQNLKNKEDSIRKSYNESFANDDWMKICRGRDILNLFVSRYVSGINYTNFRNLIINSMRDAKYQPQYMKQTLANILQDKST